MYTQSSSKAVGNFPATDNSPLTSHEPDFSATGKLGHYNVARSREDILKDFTYSRKGIWRETCHSAGIGSRKIGKTGMKLGAIIGAGMGFATAIVATIGFPPSLMAIGLSTAIGAAKGALIGGAVSFVLGGLYHGAKTALKLILTSPEQRLRKQAESGKKELDILEQRHGSGLKQLQGKDLQRLHYLQQHVPLWEGLVDELESLSADKANPTQQ